MTCLSTSTRAGCWRPKSRFYAQNIGFQSFWDNFLRTAKTKIQQTWCSSSVFLLPRTVRRTVFRRHFFSKRCPRNAAHALSYVKWDLCSRSGRNENMLDSRSMFPDLALWHHQTSDEFRMVLGGQPTPCFFFTTEFAKSNFLPCRSSTITRSCEASPMGQKGNQV